MKCMEMVLNMLLVHILSLLLPMPNARFTAHRFLPNQKRTNLVVPFMTPTSFAKSQIYDLSQITAFIRNIFINIQLVTRILASKSHER